MRFVFLILGLLFGFFVEAADDVSQQIKNNQTLEKIEVPEKVKKENNGKKIYDRFCVVCHRDGLVGAPKFQDEKAWKSRLSNRTINDLVVSALKGLNAMPAKGTCYECNEEDIKSAVEYMLPNHD